MEDNVTILPLIECPICGRKGWMASSGRVIHSITDNMEVRWQQPSAVCVIPVPA